MKDARSDRSPSIMLTLSALSMVGILYFTPRAADLQYFEAEYQVTAADSSSVSSTSLAKILGSVRASLSDFIWVKIELSQHQGVNYFEKSTDGNYVREDQRSNQKGENKVPGQPKLEHPPGDGHEHGHSHDHKEEQSHDGAKTVIPRPEDDFRGFIGDIDRAVHPWTDNQHPWHPGETEVLPWYRILTKVNPHHVRAYLVASWNLKNSDNMKESESFLLEGIENNPDAYTLYEMMVRILLKNGEHEKAITYAIQGRDIALKYRPAGGELSELWTASDEEDFRFLVRHPVFIALRHLDNPERAKLALREALPLIPKDHPLNRIARELNDLEGPQRPAK